MNLKKITACVAALSICVSGFCQFTDDDMVPNAVSAESSSEINELIYTVLDDETIEISGYEGYDENKELIIPKTIDGKTVSSIGKQAFYGHKNLISVTIPDSVTNIGPSAFGSCSALKEITIPNSVTSIGPSAFHSSGLRSITIPEGVTSIGTSTFGDCTMLETVIIPTSVASIGDYAFSGCSMLKDITIPEGVASIGNNVFFTCKRLKSITLPTSMTSIGDYAFWYCIDLTSITVPNSVTSIGNRAFYDCSQLIVYGYQGSYIQDYATKYYLKFEIIENSASVEGDIDNNGVISTSDIISLIRYIIGGEDSTNILAADINKDGEVNVLDVIYLKQILLK